MFERLFSLDHRRRRLLEKTPAGPLHDYLAVPFPSPRADCRRLPMVAVDLETTGLDPQRDEIVSFGWVVLDRQAIDLGTARHRVVQLSGAIPEQSAVIHQITDDAAAKGEAPRQVLAELLATLAGKVLVAHHARIELGFIDAACRRLLGGRFLIPAIDTQWLAQRTFQRRNKSVAPGELRLAALRNRHNLPRYRAHDALSDAVAAAELLLAQLAAQGNGPLPLRDYLLRQ